MATPEESLDERVLALMPSARDAERTRALLAGAGMACAACADIDAVCRELDAGAGVLLLTDEAVVGDAAGCLWAALGRQPAWSDVPLVILTRPGAERRHASIRESANATLVERPVRMRTLLSVVRAALRARRHQYRVRDLLDERDRAEAALRTSEQRHRALVTSSSDVVYRMSRDWAELQPLDGRGLVASNAEPIRGWMQKNVPPSEHARVTAAIAEAVASRGMFELEHRVIRPDGSPGWTSTRAVPILDAEGEVVEWFGTARDITERKASEEALRAGEERFRSLFESMDEGYCVVEPLFDGAGRAVDYRYLLANPALEQHTGLRDVVGKTARQVMPGHESHWIEAYARVAATGEPMSRTDHVADLGRWYEVSAFSVGGGQVGVLFADVTARREAEMVLRERDERLQLAVAIARMGTFEIDLQTDAVTVNEPGRDIYGWPDTRTTFSQVQTHFHPEDRDAVMRQVAAAFDPAGPGAFEVEQRIIRTDGAVRWLRVRGRATFEGEGDARRAVLCLGAYLDVTEQKEAEETLRDADRKKDDFIALLAHELRNPLAPIRNGLNVLRLAGADPEAVGETREIMERQITHMVRLIDDLMDVSRINRSKMELRLSRVTLAEALDSALETARPLIDAAGHTLTVSVPDRPIYIEADLTRLAQVFGNLLSNSAKYTRHGGEIRLSAERRGDEVAVSVSDNGIGIPPGSLANIFDMFSQVDRSIERATGGLGIGLALVRGLVEMHGGTVAAASAGEGRGSTFTVTLPVAAPPAATATTPTSNGQPETRRRILIVDDSRDGASTLARMLRLMGNDVRTASDGLEGVEAAGEFLPEVVLMDVGMPVLNGLDATRRIREQEWGRDMTIIALTGWGQEGDKERSRAAGCDGHLVKPVDFDALEKLLDAGRG